jgi:hypothetical protein
VVAAADTKGDRLFQAVMWRLSVRGVHGSEIGQTPQGSIHAVLMHPLVELRVAEYRAYVVGHDGHFVRFESLICADDAEAIAKAKRLVVVDHDVELWSGKRFVIRLEVTT